MSIMVRDSEVLELDIESNCEIETVAGARCKIVLQIKDNSSDKTIISMKTNKDSVIECVLVYNCSADKKTNVLWTRELCENTVLKSVIAFTDSGSHILHRTTSLAMKSALDEAELFIGKATQTFSLTHEVVNQAPDTKATVLTKGVLLDQSKSYCKGNMIIAPAACNSSSWLGQHVLLLSKDAKADALPCLEIKNNDVKAYHAATVAPLDEQHLFYLTSRGLSLHEAQRIISEGFLLPLIESCELLHIREFLQSRIYTAFEVLCQKPPTEVGGVLLWPAKQGGF